MDLAGIQDIFSAIAIGSVCFLFLLIAIWTVFATSTSFSNWIVTNFLEPYSKMILIVVVLILSLGFIIQDFTDYLTDSDTEANKTIFKFQRFCLGKESKHRFDSIIITKKGPSGKTIYQLRSGIGKALFNNNHKVYLEYHIKNIHDAIFVRDPDKFLKGISDYSSMQISDSEKLKNEEKLKSVTSFINNLYYTAKNWCYSQQTYYDELKNIQSRVDMSRSLFFISTISLLFMLILGILGYMFRKSSSFTEKTIIRNYISTIFIYFIFTFLLAFVSISSFKMSERNFNERAFGYYISHIDNKFILKEKDKNKDNRYNATKWISESYEYKASSIQAYNSAKNSIDRAIKDMNWTACIEQQNMVNQKKIYLSEFNEKEKYAVIFDIDETVLDNSLFQKTLVSRQVNFSRKLWNKWVMQMEAKSVPGVVNFIDYLDKKYPTIKKFFITNRKCSLLSNGCPEKIATIENLKKLGITVDKSDILLQGEKPEWGKDKISRRAFISKYYRILMIFGDNIFDFVPPNELESNFSVYFSKENETINYWGEKWFIFSNPIYGSWVK